MAIDPVDIPKLASTCSLLGDQSRLKILFLLEWESHDVTALCDLVGIKQPSLSRHLRLMSQENLVSSYRDGKHIYYLLDQLGRVVLAGLKTVAKCQQ